MRKSIIGIIMAVTLVGSSLAFPVQAYAADVEAGQKVDINDGTVNQNNGTVTTNNGSVGTNNGEINYNNGMVEKNNERVWNNKEGATVKTNAGRISNNYGTVTTNNKTVAFNYAGATITTNGSEGFVSGNHGTLETNNGSVFSNKSGATITTNNGTVQENHGTLETNNGTVVDNMSDGIVNSNNGTVETNIGIVETNYRTVQNNYGKVELNYGTVENNYGGTVVNGGGTVTNQWYEYILTGGRYIDSSRQTTTGDNRTWIGKAGSTDNVLGDFYITVAANDGMTFDYATVGDEQVQGITNADGSISFGNISSAIRIFFKQFIYNNNNNNAGEENTNNSSDSDTNYADMMATIESIIANEEAMPVTSFISDEAVEKIPEAAKNSGASYNLSVITSSQGFTAAINKISEAVKVQNAVNNATNNNTARRTSVTVYSDKPMNFTADILNAISASDIDFVFVFMHNGKMYRVTIPRGTVIDFSGHVYEGPLFIGQILGTTEEIG